MSRCNFEFLVVDADLPDAPALDWMDGLQQDGRAPRSCWRPSDPTPSRWLQALRRGVATCSSGHFEPDDAAVALQRACQGAEDGAQRAGDPGSLGSRCRRRELIGDSPQMRAFAR
jgi:DNA-binding NtrC family response regulator